MRIFLDTNVAVDYLTIRDEYYSNAAFIIEMIRKGYVDAVVSSLTLINCAYVMKKHFDKHMVLDKLFKFMQLFMVSEINSETIKSAIQMQPYDLEDAIQFISAVDYKPDIIITRDKKGFNDFEIPVMTPTVFLEKCNIKMK